MVRIFISILALCATTALWAQQTSELTLAQAIDYALKSKANAQKAIFFIRLSFVLRLVYDVRGRRYTALLSRYAPLPRPIQVAQRCENMFYIHADVLFYSKKNGFLESNLPATHPYHVACSGATSIL